MPNGGIRARHAPRPASGYNRAAMGDTEPRRDLAKGRAVVIANPAAGGGGRSDSLRAAVGAFAEAGWTVSLCRTERLGHARALATEAARDGVELVVAAGGDGTVNEVTNGLVGTRSAMGVLPAGTGNVLAAQLGLIGVPTPLHRGNLEWAAGELCRGTIRAVDVGVAEPRSGEPRHFLLWAGVGLDAAVTHEIEGPARDLKRMMGPAAFGAVGLRSAWRLKGTDTVVLQDGAKTRGALLWAIVANVPLYAGAFRLSSDVRIDDGRLDVALLFGVGLVSSLVEAVRAKLGRPGAAPWPETSGAGRVRFNTSGPMPVHIDAEPFGSTPIRFSVRERALRLLVPPAAPADLFEGARRAPP